MPRPAPYAVPGYRLHDLIGEGTAGSVYLARSVASAPAPPVAVKVVPRSKVRAAVRREVALHMSLSHPNIAKLHRVVAATPPSSHSPPSLSAPTPAALALVLDHAPRGDMFSEVAASGSLPPRVLRRRLRDIVSALSYLHAQHIVHLDLKLENVVLTNASAAQLIDFGCARHLHTPHHDSVPLGGTLHYLAPEVVEASRPTPAMSSDAWSLGVLAYTSVAGFYPFNAASSDSSAADNDHATRYRIVNCRPHPLPSSINLPSDLRRIIFGLLEKDPRHRMTIAQVAAELDRAINATSVFALPRPVPKHHRVDDCACLKRPCSPASTSDADFEPCSCAPRQSPDDALRVVDDLQRSRCRADAEVRRYISNLRETNLLPQNPCSSDPCPQKVGGVHS